MVDIQGIITEIDQTQIYSKTLEFKKNLYRLAQICCVRLEDGYELDYSFADQESNMETLRVNIGTDDEIPSISAVYVPAFLYENEMKELFGVKITSISLDYNNRLYRIQNETPFKQKGLLEEVE